VGGTVDCLDDNTVQFEMSTTGPAASTEVFSQETGNSSPSGQYSDNHNLDSIGNGEWEQTLATGVNPPVTDESTLFRCDRNAQDLPYHHNAGPALVMSYIFRAYDSTGTEFDCVSVGHDPAGIIAGTETRVNEPTNASDISAVNCRIEEFTY
ncbi:MAG: hypothetical protein AAGA48_34455, partial [Myxococcota bacterium]